MCAKLNLLYPEFNMFFKIVRLRRLNGMIQFVAQAELKIPHNFILTRIWRFFNSDSALILKNFSLYFKQRIFQYFV